MAVVHGLSINQGKLDVQLEDKHFSKDTGNKVSLKIGSGLTTDGSGIKINIGADFEPFDSSNTLRISSVYRPDLNVQGGLSYDGKVLKIKAGEGLMIHSDGTLKVNSQALDKEIYVGTGIQKDPSGSLILKLSSKTIDGVESGLEADAKGLRLRLDVSGGLAFSPTGGISAKAGNGITIAANGVSVNPGAGLQISAGKVAAKVGAGLKADVASGVQVNVGTGLKADVANGVQVKVGTGLKATLDGGIWVDASVLANMLVFQEGRIVSKE